MVPNDAIDTEESPEVKALLREITAGPLVQYADGDLNAEYHCLSCGQNFNRPVPGHLDPVTGSPCQGSGVIQLDIPPV